MRLTRPFCLSVSEVNVAQFRRFVEATDYRTTVERGESQAVGFKPVQLGNGPEWKQPFNRGAEFNWKNPGFAQTDEHPVVCVSWQDAQAFCKWLGEKERCRYRLPTEAEWEYACRAGARTSFAWGNKFHHHIYRMANIGNVELERAHEDLATRQWFFDIEHEPGDGHVYTAPVTSFPPNAWGLYDMHGNVWEWCHDTYSDTIYEQYRGPGHPRPHHTAVDPVHEKPWNQFGNWRVIRGGSWFTSPAFCRADIRGYFDAPDAACYLGFRVVRDAPPEMIQSARDDWEKEQAAIERVKEINDFEARGKLKAERAVSLRGAASAEVTQDLHRISALVGVSASGVDASFFQNVSKVKALKSIHVYDLGKLTDDDLAPLKTLANLDDLLLSGRSSLTDGCIQHLTGLTNLWRLQLSGDAITDKGLSKFQQLKHLEELYLEGTKTQGAILSSLGRIPLKTLVLPDLSDEHAEQIVTLRKLETFRCSGPSLTDVGFTHFAGLERLKGLDLRGCRSISPSGFGPLRSLIKLTSLDLRETQAGDEAVRHLAHHYRLSSLSLSGDNLTDAGMPHICEVISLQRLAIRDNSKITDKGLRDFWRLQRLYGLELRCAKLTGTGFSTLTEIPHLYNLTIASSALTDEALEHISAMPNLLTLRLDGTDRQGGAPALTDAGLMILADAERLKEFHVDVRNTQITEAAIDRLKTANPELKIQVQR